MMPTPLVPRALADSSTGGVFFWSLILIVLLIIGAAAVLRLRRWLKEDDAPTGGIGFTLSDLRQLHKQGKMTDEEFERARAKMVDAGRAMAAKMPHPLARPTTSSSSSPGSVIEEERARRRLPPRPGSSDTTSDTPHTPDAQ